MLSKMELHVSSLTRPYGGILYANKPPAINEERLVPLRTMSDGSKRFVLEPTVGYIIAFRESVPEDILEAGYSVWYDLRQAELISLGAFMWINWQPFMGYLLANQQMEIEQGTRLATLSWDTFIDDEEEVDVNNL